MQLDATLYRTNVQDEIVLFPYDEEGEPEGSTIDGFFANIPRTRREGLDASAMLVLRNAARVSVNLSTTRATFQTGDIELFSIRELGGEENEVEVGDVMPLVPDRRVTFRAESSPLHRVRVGWNTRYTGKQWLRGDEANDTAPLDGYWVSDAHAALRMGRWELQGAVRNLFDSRYASFGTFNINQGAGNVLERFLTPGQVRTVSLRLSRNFGTASN